MQSQSAGRTFLEDLSGELTGLAVMLAQFAERDALPRETVRDVALTPRQVCAMIGARHARSAVFGLDLANPGWSLLLELFRAHLEDRPAKMARLATDVRVASTTMLRWIDLFCKAGLAERLPDPRHDRGVILRLTPAGAEAMHDHFAAVKAGWLSG